MIACTKPASFLKSRNAIWIVDLTVSIEKAAAASLGNKYDHRCLRLVRMRTIIIEPEAKADLIAAIAYYEQEQPGLGSRFLVACDELFLRLSKRPPVSCLSARSA